MIQHHRRNILKVIALSCILGTVAGCSHSSSDAQDNPLGLITPGQLRVASISDGRPNTYTDESGNFTGFDVEYLRAVAKRMGINKVTFIGTDFSSILPGVASGQYDVGDASIAITPERLKTVDFSNGYLAGYIVLFGKPSGAIKNLNDLAGHRIGVVQGTIEDTYASSHFNKAQIVRFPEPNSAISALNNGTIDAMFDDYNPAQAYKKEYGLITIANISAFDQPAGFAIAKNKPALQAALNKAIKSTMADGTWEKIWKQWFPTVPMPPMYMAKNNQDTSNTTDTTKAQ